MVLDETRNITSWHSLYPSLQSAMSRAEASPALETHAPAFSLDSGKSLSVRFLIHIASIYFTEFTQELNKMVYVRGCKLKHLRGQEGRWTLANQTYKPFSKGHSPCSFLSSEEGV